MPRIGRNNSSNEGSRGGHAIPASMKGRKLANRLPHLSPNVDGSFSSDVRGRTRTITKGSLYQVFRTAGANVFTVPEGVDSFTVTAIGGGGGSPNGRHTHGASSNGGGGGAEVTVTFTEVAPNTQITFTVGAGGASSNFNTHAANGGDTTFRYDGFGYTAGGGCGGNKTHTLGTGGSGGVATGPASATLVHGHTGHRGFQQILGCGGVGQVAPNGQTYGFGASAGNGANGFSGGTGDNGAIIIS